MTKNPTSQSVLSSKGKAQARLFLIHEEQIAQRLRIQSWVRFGVVGFMIVGALVAKHWVNIQDLDVRNLIILALLLATFNVGVFTIVSRYTSPESVKENYRFLYGLTHLTIDVDFLFLTVSLWFVGGPKSPFQAFYLIHVTLAGLLLTPFAAYMHTLLGYSLFVMLVLGEWFELIPAHMPIGLVNSMTPLDSRFVLTVLVVQGLLMLLSVSLSIGLARLLHEGESHLREANLHLEQAAAMRKDFFHIVLHDLKSPISAAMMVLNSMKEDPQIESPERQHYWLEKLSRRLQETLELLRDFDVLAALDGNVVEQNRKAVDLALLIRKVIEERQEIIRLHRHSVFLEIEDALPQVDGVERLLHEAIANYVMNAVKYTPPGGRIVIRAFRNNGFVRVEVEDNGIGISEEDQKRLFREFMRVRRNVLPEQRPTGSGLGLSIVRRIVEAHGGVVGVQSQLNKGSTFYMELPVFSFEKETADPDTKS